MIGAGTGILPFIDLLDFLFKKQMYASMQINGMDTSIIQPNQDYASIFPGARFNLLCAFRTIEDFIGWEWIDKLASLSHLSGNNLFKCTARVKGNFMFHGIE